MTLTMPDTQYAVYCSNFKYVQSIRSEILFAF